MASGVTVSDGVIRVFSDIKVHRFSTPEVDKQKKTKLFCLSEDKKEEGKGILGGVVGQTVDDPYTFVKMLPDKNCDCALYNAIYETKNKKEGLVFVFWAPDSAPLKNKMICASPKDAIKKKLTEIKHELQANC